MGILVDVISAFKECKENSRYMKRVAQLVKDEGMLSIWEASKKADPEQLNKIKECADAVKAAREVSPLNRNPEQLKIISKFENRGFWQNFKTQITDMRLKKISAQLEKNIRKPSTTFGRKTPWGLLIFTGVLTLGMLALMTKDSWLPKVKGLFGAKKDNKVETESVDTNNKPAAAEAKSEMPKAEVKADTETKAEDEKPVEPKVKNDVKPETTTNSAPDFYEVKSGDGLWGIANKHLKAVLGRRPNDMERSAYMEEIISANKDKKLKWNEAHTAVSIHPGMTLRMPEWNQKLAVSYSRELKSALAQPQVKKPVKETKAQVSDTNTAKVAGVADTNVVKAKSEKKEISVKDSVQQVSNEQQSKHASDTAAKIIEDQNAAFFDSVSTEYNKVLSFNKPLHVLKWADSNYKNHITPLEVDVNRAMQDENYRKYIRSEEFLKDKEEQQAKYDKWLKDTVYPAYDKYIDSLYKENKKQMEQQK